MKYQVEHDCTVEQNWSCSNSNRYLIKKLSVKNWKVRGCV